MFIKIINFARKNAQTRRDLKRRLMYLLLPKAPVGDDRTRPRLMGPPLGLHLLIKTPPWGDTAESAADDLSKQMLQYAKDACDGKPFPRTWYLHILLSFHPRDAHHIDDPKDALADRSPFRSRTNTMMRISLDLLKTLGISLTQPILLVPHSDRRHLHVHAMVILPLKNTFENLETTSTADWHKGLSKGKSSLHPDGNYLLQYSREDLYEISIIGTKVFSLTPPSKRTMSKNKKIQKLWSDLESRDS